MNPWMIVSIVLLVGVGIYEFQAWGRRNQSIKDFEGKMKVTLYRKNGIEDVYILEVDGGFLKFPNDISVSKPSKGEYIVDQTAMSTILWPPNANKFSQVLLKSISYDEGIATPRKRPSEDPANDKCLPLAAQLQFARTMAFMDFAARIGNNLNDFLNAIKNPKPSMLLIILLIAALLGIAINIYFGWSTHNAIVGG